MRDPKERLCDILAAIEAIQRHLDRGRTAFEHDELLQGWFVRNLQIIGEAARALPEEVRALAPEIPWVKMIGMRHVLVHGYFEIDTEIVVGSGRAGCAAAEAGHRKAVAGVGGAGRWILLTPDCGPVPGLDHSGWAGTAFTCLR